MAVSLEDRINMFKEELDLFISDDLRNFTIMCLANAPDYVFYDCPASSSGKYHPVDELSGDGTVLHTKKVFTVAYAMSKALGCDDIRDEVLCAAIVHDLVKQGWNKTGHTVRKHPMLAADLVKEVYEGSLMITEYSYIRIRNMVGFHYGLWSTGEWIKDITKYTPEELCLYLSDFVCSKREVSVSYKR